MRAIYNEGRVVGLSSYELFVKRQLAEGADPADIPSESEWVTSSITDAKGGAMILRIPSGSHGVRDFVLPSGTTLCGSGPMYATLFEGDVDLDTSGVWGQHVTDYGRLISNTPSSSPIAPGRAGNVPTKPNPSVMTPTYRAQCVDYMKINSAIAVQPGDWEPSDQTFPYKKLRPVFNYPGFVRVSFSAETTSDIYIMITGFISTEILTEFIDVEDFTADYKDGQTLGPVVFPWASKIQMLMTTDSLKGYIDWYLDATLTTEQYQALPVKEDKFYFTRKEL